MRVETVGSGPGILSAEDAGVNQSSRCGGRRGLGCGREDHRLGALGNPNILNVALPSMGDTAYLIGSQTKVWAAP